MLHNIKIFIERSDYSDVTEGLGGKQLSGAHLYGNI